MKTQFAAALLATLTASTLANVIVEQPYDGSSPGYWAQEFPDWPELSIWEFDDLHTGQDWAVTTLTVFGFDNGPPDLIESVQGQIWDGLPGSFGGAVVLGSVAGAYNGDGTLTIDFGEQALPAGDYWITAWVTRVTAGFEQDYFWYATTPVSASECYAWNPSGFFWGPDPLPASEAYGQPPRDLAFRLEGTPLAECPGDLDGDGDTDQSDLGILLSDWGCTGSDCPGDLDGDGDTDQSDLGILLSDWGCGL